jgi:hypothetical protein
MTKENRSLLCDLDKELFKRLKMKPYPMILMNDNKEIWELNLKDGKWKKKGKLDIDEG